MKKPNLIFIDPNSHILFSAFYIKGLYDVFGKENVKFSSKHFNDLIRNKKWHYNDQFLAFVLVDSFGRSYKYIIDFNDPPSVIESMYVWADIYAKVNFNKITTPKEFREKLIPIPPGMSIKIWSLFESIFNLLNNLRLCGLRPVIPLKLFIKFYFAQNNRPRIEDYLNNKTKRVNEKHKPYIFMNSSLWPHKNCIETTNIYRNAFYTICKQSNYIFEGGFRILLRHQKHPQLKEFKKNIAKIKYSSREFLEKTKKSILVFNTPSVHNCHGWRISENLALGKAIMSTKFYNEIPVPLEHGKNIHFISNNENFKPDFDKIIDSSEYRQKLENEARKYFIEYVSPEKVIKSIVSRNI